VTTSIPAPPALSTTRFTIDGVVSSTLDSSSFTPGSVPSITAQYCTDSIFGTYCGASGTVSPSSGSAPTTMWVEYPTDCPAPGTPPAVTISGGGSGTADVVVTSTDDPITGTVTYDLSLTWIGAFAGLTAPPPHQLVCPL
jgi:hypothetical protein